MSTVQDILDHALRLQPSERATIASQLLASLPDDLEVSESGIESAWADEANHRLAEYRAGRGHAVEWNEALRQVRDALPTGKSS